MPGRDRAPSAASLTALRSGAGGVLVAACDLVDLDAGTVAVVLGDGEGDQPRVACSDRLEPALAYWPSAATGALERCFDAGVRALHEALDTIGYVAVPVAVEAMRNVNRPAEVPPS